MKGIFFRIQATSCVLCFVITNVTIPDGTFDCESLYEPGLVESNISTVTVVLAEPTGGGDVVGVVVVTGGAIITPAAPWPPTACGGSSTKTTRTST